MGHHHISEVNSEKFEFTRRSKAIVGGIFLVGLILTFIGVSKLKTAEESKGKEADEQKVEQTEEHTTPVHAVDMQDDVDEHHAEGTHTEKADDHAEKGHSEGASHGKIAGSVQASWLTQLWANLLLNSYYFLLFAAAALFFIALNYASNAGWSTLLKRVMESITSYLPIGILLLVAVIYFGKEYLYDWVEYFQMNIPSDSPLYKKVLAEKDWFLTENWLLIGVPLILVIWWAFRVVLVKLSHREDEEGGTTFFKKSVTYSAAFLVVFAFSFSLMSWLVMMSIDPLWYSTIYSVYNFAIAFVTGLTVICFFTLYLKSKGYMEVVSDEVIHDLGKFMFAFSIFWAYIWVSQYLLIWYANMGEETIYYVARTSEHYRPMFRTNFLMCFILPFLILMMRKAKRSPKVLLVAGSIILLGHWLDLFLMIMPGTVGENASIGLLEIGMTMTFAGLFIFWILNNLSKKNLYAKNHPYLLESANHDVGV